MADITTQLARITAPSITDSGFADNMKKVFDNINQNFKTIASLPFIQGVQGDSYKLVSKEIWTTISEDGEEIIILSKDGAILLNSIFSTFFNSLDDKEYYLLNAGDRFDMCREEKLKLLELNGTSPIDSFISDENKLVNNNLYFYSIINDLDEEQDSYMGQYYYFIDARLNVLGELYNSETTSKNLVGFTDYTGFYQYNPKSENTPEFYSQISIIPNLYYDQNKNDICWKFNGQYTGISAIGAKGADGKDATFKIVFVGSKTTGETGEIETNDNSAEIIAYYDPEQSNNTEGISGIVYLKENEILPDSFCLVQFVDLDTDGKIISYTDSAFGQIYNGNAYWENDMKIGSLFNNENITKYFSNMGTNTEGVQGAPLFFAIPAYQDRSTNTNDFLVAHVFKTIAENQGLLLKKFNNAFTNDGGQYMGTLTGPTEKSIFNIANYNIHVGSDTDATNKTEITDSSIDIYYEGESQISLKNNGLSEISGELKVTEQVITKNIEGEKLDIGEIDASISITGKTGKFEDLKVDNVVEIDNNLIVKNNAYIEKGLSASADWNQSNVLYGINNPGNGPTFGENPDSNSSDFSINVEKAGYPLVIKSTAADGTTKKSYMIFGDTDIYSVKQGLSGIEPNTLCLNHRSGYFGDVLIGKNLTVGDTGKKGNLSVNGDISNTGNLTVTGSVNIGVDLDTTGKLDVNGKITGHNNIEIHGIASIHNELTVDNDLHCKGTLKAYTNIDCTNNIKTSSLEITGNNGPALTIGSNGNINTAGDITTTGAITTTGNITAVNIDASGNLYGPNIMGVHCSLDTLTVSDLGEFSNQVKIGAVDIVNDNNDGIEIKSNGQEGNTQINVKPNQIYLKQIDSISDDTSYIDITGDSIILKSINDGDATDSSEIKLYEDNIRMAGDILYLDVNEVYSRNCQINIGEQGTIKCGDITADNNCGFHKDVNIDGLIKGKLRWHNTTSHSYLSSEQTVHSVNVNNDSFSAQVCVLGYDSNGNLKETDQNGFYVIDYNTLKGDNLCITFSEYFPEGSVLFFLNNSNKPVDIIRGLFNNSTTELKGHTNSYDINSSFIVILGSSTFTAKIGSKVFTLRCPIKYIYLGGKGGGDNENSLPK